MAAEFYRQVGQQQVISMAAAKAKGVFALWTFI
jgi:hypothetical protein